jgi:hypothetical protein
VNDKGRGTVALAAFLGGVARDRNSKAIINCIL